MSNDRTQPNQGITVQLHYLHSTDRIPANPALPSGWKMEAVDYSDPRRRAASRQAHREAMNNPRLMRFGQVGRMPHVPTHVLYARVPEGFVGTVRAPWYTRHFGGEA